MAGTCSICRNMRAIMWKILRKCHHAVDKVMPKGTRKRKIAGYFKNTVFHPGENTGSCISRRTDETGSVEISRSAPVTWNTEAALTMWSIRPFPS